MRPTASSFVVAALASLSAFASVGCGGATDATSADEGAIIGGTVDKADRAIVELIETTGGDEWSCTAELISPTVLLTAAHCMVSDDNPKVIPADATFKIMRNYADSAAKKADYVTIPRANVHAHPGYDGDAAHDVGVLVLPSPITDVAPLPINTSALTAKMAGNAIRIVGYGQSVRKSGTHDGSGTKRSASATLQKLEGNLVLIGKTGDQACDGDSGGPALMKIDGVETLVGTDDLASNDADCTKGDLYQRTDLQMSFLAKYLAVETSGEDDGGIATGNDAGDDAGITGDDAGDEDAGDDAGTVGDDDDGKKQPGGSGNKHVTR